VLGSLLVAHGCNSIQEYKERPFSAEIQATDNFSPELISKLKKAEKTMALEYLGFLRTGMDVSVEYNNHDELKRLRHTYLLHMLDYVCQDKQRVFENDMAELAEKNKDRVTLSNVFDLAEGEKEESSEEEDQSSEEEEK